MTEEEILKEFETLWDCVRDLRRSLEQIAGNLEYVKEIVDSVSDVLAKRVSCEACEALSAACPAHEDREDPPDGWEH